MGSIGVSPVRWLRERAGRMPTSPVKPRVSQRGPLPQGSEAGPAGRTPDQSLPRSSPSSPDSNRKPGRRAPRDRGFYRPARRWVSSSHGTARCGAPRRSLPRVWTRFGAVAIRPAADDAQGQS